MGARPSNKGHQKILNIILLCELTCVVFGLIIKTELLSQAAATVMSIITLGKGVPQNEH
jgi:hypothetical protein